MEISYLQFSEFD